MGRLIKVAEPRAPGVRLHNWNFDKALSGDTLVEQDIHFIAVMFRLVNTTPLRAAAAADANIQLNPRESRPVVDLSLSRNSFSRSIF